MLTSLTIFLRLAAWSGAVGGGPEIRMLSERCSTSRDSVDDDGYGELDEYGSMDGEGCVRVRTRRKRVTDCSEFRVSRESESFATAGNGSGSHSIFSKDEMEEVEAWGVNRMHSRLEDR
ncbi:hypothetical protein C8R45DRAFT_1002145 [Mycena sanguinolenta]|nr:hypothetical protein C8R45DRAFT_1002145 [Mycena sanguinolenta]